MRRRPLVLGAVSLGTVPRAQAQSQRAARIGMLSGRDNPSLAGFVEEMEALGWREGRNLVIERREAHGDAARTRAVAAELAALDLDAIFANTSPAAEAARAATTRVPIVYAMLGDPVAMGWEASFARPRGNATGIAGVDPEEIAGKRMEILRDAVPAARRIAVIFAPGTVTAAPSLRGSEAAAQRLGIVLRSEAVKDIASAEAAFATLAGWGAQAVSVAQSQILATQPLQGRIVAITAAARLPAIHAESDWVELGGLMSYTPDQHEMGRRAAVFADRILRGAKPAELPIERPSRLELRINLRSARAMGIELPPSILARADGVLE